MNLLINTILVLLVLSQEPCGTQELTEQVLKLNSKSVITVENGGKWGDWGSANVCSPGTYAVGLSLLVEDYQGPGIAFDDTALNGIRLFCSDLYGQQPMTFVQSKLGYWGSWTKVHLCPLGPLKAFQLKVEAPQGVEDDTAASNIRFLCDTLTLHGEGMRFGTWGSWSDQCEKDICGIQTKVEKPQGLGDDTALNDVTFLCCNV